jgi:predicted DNA-binding protein (UPF0251 family)
MSPVLAQRAGGVRRVSLTAAEQAAAVRLMVSWGLGFAQSRRRLGVSEATVRRALAQVREMAGAGREGS